MTRSSLVLLSLLLVPLAQQLPAMSLLRQGHIDFLAEPASAETRRLADWIAARDDAQGLPFMIIDKPGAHIFAFAPSGRILGSSPVLLGLARGDVSAPGIGNRKLADIGPADRITPAGRFVASVGRNLAGKDILWVDYAAAISLHRVVTSKIAEHRLQRLASPSIDDNRISYGCINVPVAFYDNVVKPLFSATSGIVYVMPDNGKIDDIFPINAINAVLPVDAKRKPADQGS